MSIPSRGPEAGEEVELVGRRAEGGRRVQEAELEKLKEVGAAVRVVVTKLALC